MDYELTVIIPFKNEGEEVGRTINSIVLSAKYKIHIIVINDGSDDEFDYTPYMKLDNIMYVIHDVSLGPAGTKAHGVSLCKTKYFIILDAHMRALTPAWDELILNELKRNKRSISCCKTATFVNNDIICDEYGCGFGAHINIFNLSPSWITVDIPDDNNVCKTPCLMGASYCGNLEYWKQIHGLEGLLGYGFEEQLISIKAILEGGMCYVIKNVTFAHKFRQEGEIPYKIETFEYIYNQLYIIELFYPKEFKIKTFKNIKFLCDENNFEKAINELYLNRDNISKLKEYYKGIFTRDFSSVIELNEHFKQFNT